MQDDHRPAASNDFVIQHRAPFQMYPGKVSRRNLLKPNSCSRWQTKEHFLAAGLSYSGADTQNPLGHPPTGQRMRIGAGDDRVISGGHARTGADGLGWRVARFNTGHERLKPKPGFHVKQGMGPKDKGQPVTTPCGICGQHSPPSLLSEYGMIRVRECRGRGAGNHIGPAIHGEQTNSGAVKTAQNLSRKGQDTAPQGHLCHRCHQVIRSRSIHTHQAQVRGQRQGCDDVLGRDNGRSRPLSTWCNAWGPTHAPASRP